MVLRWGIAGAGRISHDFVTAVQSAYPIDHKVVAVAARSEDGATVFAKEHQIPKAYGGYEKLAMDHDVDIVYVGNLNTQHFSTCKMMLEQGKHVLCEKPFTMNEKQSRRLIELARSRKLFIMEAVWSRCFPVYHEAKRMMDSGEIGDVLFAAVHFGHALQHVERLTTVLDMGGTILDVGVAILDMSGTILDLVGTSLDLGEIIFDLGVGGNNFRSGRNNFGSRRNNFGSGRDHFRCGRGNRLRWGSFRCGRVNFRSEQDNFRSGRKNFGFCGTILGAGGAIDPDGAILDVGVAILDLSGTIFDPGETILDVGGTILDLGETILDGGGTILDVGVAILDLSGTILDLVGTSLDLGEIIFDLGGGGQF
nr:unnamed protein product [Callosobruchus analis]